MSRDIHVLILKNADGFGVYYVAKYLYIFSAKTKEECMNWINEHDNIFLC